MFPEWILDGKKYKTVKGLYAALFKKHSAAEVSGVGADRVLRVYSSRDVVAACYAVSAPKVGEPMTLTLK